MGIEKNIPNSSKQHHKNCMADSKENQLEDLESEGLPKWKSKVGN